MQFDPPQGLITVLLSPPLSLPLSLPPSPPHSFLEISLVPVLSSTLPILDFAGFLYPLRSFIMDITLVYTIVVSSCFGLLMLINGLPLIARLVRYLSPLVSKHLIYRYVLHRHRFLGPWSRAGVLVQLIYIAGNGSHSNAGVLLLLRSTQLGALILEADAVS